MRKIRQNTKGAICGGGEPKAALKAFTFVMLFMALSLAAACNKDKKDQKPSEQPMTQPEATASHSATVSEAPAAQEGGAPARKEIGQDQSFTLIYTTGVVGELVDCGCPHHPRGGLARRAKYIEGISGARPIVQVDGGNAFFSFGPRPNFPEHEKVKAEVIAKGEAKMGVDAANVGLYDLTGGLDFLKDKLAQQKGQKPLPLISANLTDPATGELIFPAYKTVDVNGSKVCIFGLTDVHGLPETVKGLDPLATASKTINELAPRCDLLVGLYAMSLGDASRLAKQAPGADIIVASDRSSTPRARPMVVGTSLEVQAGNRGMYLGRMDLTLKAGAGESMPEAKRNELRDKLDRVEAQKAILDGPIGSTPELKDEYLKTLNDEREISDQLQESVGRFDHKGTVISMDLDLPEDPEVAGWVEQAGVKPKTPH